MFKEDYRERFIRNQFYIPKDLFFLAQRFPTVTWLKAQELYKEAVNEILKKYKTDCILDVGEFCKGVRMAAISFEEKLVEYVKSK